MSSRGPSEIAILSDIKGGNWESILIQGALWHHGIQSRIVSCKTEDIINEHSPVIVLPAESNKDAMRPHLQRIRGPLILAGRKVTIDYTHNALMPSARDVIVYGEPYATVPQIAKDEDLWRKLRGKAVLGAPFNPSEYSTPEVTIKKDGWTPIMTSVGCQKKCGYCTYGVTYSQLYPGIFSRRSRPWQDIKSEITGFLARGCDHFMLISDQFLSVNPEENEDIRSLAAHWNMGDLGRPSLTFTASPAEITKNKEILKSMSNSFRLHPRLSIDSFDDDTLSLFNLNFNSQEALEALEFIAELRLPLRINYIWTRPNMTIQGIKKELYYLKLMADRISYLDRHEKLLLVQDIFSKRLEVLCGSPLEKKGTKGRYEEDLAPDVLRMLSAIQRAIVSELAKQCINGEEDPLLIALEAGIEKANGLVCE